MTDLHVATTGRDTWPGTPEQPLRTIDAAAQRALPGDTVTVHAGEYREWVAPRRGGLGPHRRITYEAAAGEHVVIKGSEAISEWRHVDGGLWLAEVPNEVFGAYNPYALEVDGDWIVYPPGTPKKHLGEVYLDGVSLYEAMSREEVAAPERRTTVRDRGTSNDVPIADPDRTLLVWYAEVGDDVTRIWANFQGADPGEHLVEINVRRSVFYPLDHHVDYITVRGFELAHAACPWTPPTADQPGLIGPNWAKGWIIEDNVIHDAKCSAISLGKERSTGHNHSTERGDKPGYQYQLESVFAARQIGWDAEHIGSHVVRNNTIHDCGQNAIVGHLGCVFSTIENNHIHDIALKREFWGYEIGGIKLHAAIDVRIEGNRIHDCSLGIWLDWQAQGTRITRNVLYSNNRDLFVEVSHGPTLVDHNILGSGVSLECLAQGCAFVNNLIAGTLALRPVVDRATPYHVPHSTQVAGYAVVFGGDDRYVGNVFLDGEGLTAYGPMMRHLPSFGHGTAGYDGHPGSLEEYAAQLGHSSQGDHERYMAKQPVYVRDNVYVGGAKPYEKETRPVVLAGAARFRLVEEGDAVHLESSLPAAFDALDLGVLDGSDLPPVRLVGADFEERDGTPVRLDVDLAGERRSADRRSAPGPLRDLSSAVTRTRVW